MDAGRLYSLYSVAPLQAHWTRQQSALRRDTMNKTIVEQILLPLQEIDSRPY